MSESKKTLPTIKELKRYFSKALHPDLINSLEIPEPQKKLSEKLLKALNAILDTERIDGLKFETPIVSAICGIGKGKKFSVSAEATFRSPRQLVSSVYNFLEFGDQPMSEDMPEGSYNSKQDQFFVWPEGFHFFGDSDSAISFLSSILNKLKEVDRVKNEAAARVDTSPLKGRREYYDIFSAFPAHLGDSPKKATPLDVHLFNLWTKDGSQGCLWYEARDFFLGFTLRDSDKDPTVFEEGYDIEDFKQFIDFYLSVCRNKRHPLHLSIYYFITPNMDEKTLSFEYCRDNCLTSRDGGLRRIYRLWTKSHSERSGDTKYIS